MWRYPLQANGVSLWELIKVNTQRVSIEAWSRSWPSLPLKVLTSWQLFHLVFAGQVWAGREKNQGLLRTADPPRSWHWTKALNICPEDEMTARTGLLKVDTKVGTTRGMVLPEVEELDMEGWKPAHVARNEGADDELAPGKRRDRRL